MKKGQKLTVAAILLAPVILGLLLMIVGHVAPSSKFPTLSSKKIGRVEIIGEILSSEDYVKQLRTLRQDDDVVGVILRIDSPGGAVAPSQEIFEEVMKFRDKNIPVIVSMGNLAASGGYYIASPAERIFANPGTITGSIGALMIFPHYYKLLSKVGVDVDVIKAGALKDIGNPAREMTGRERAYLQAMIDDVHRQFIEDVSKTRSIDIDSLIPIADGRVFTGRQALKAKLVDTLGSYEDALAYLRSEVKVSDKAPIAEEKRETPFWKKLFAEELFDKFPFLKQATYPAGSYFLYDGSIK